MKIPCNPLEKLCSKEDLKQTEFQNRVVEFINPGSPMNPLSYKTRPSRRCSDSTCLGRTRYIVTGQDHDPIPDWHLRPGDLVGAPTEKAARGGTVV